MIRLRNALALVLLSALCFGCSSESHAIEEVENSISTPLQFEDVNATWSKVDVMEESDTEQLADYLRDNPSISENPLVEGDPLVYSSGDGVRRYYWVREGIEGPEWFCMQFDDYDVEVLNGSGEPFASNSASL